MYVKREVCDSCVLEKCTQTSPYLEYPKPLPLHSPASSYSPPNSNNFAPTPSLSPPPY